MRHCFLVALFLLCSIFSIAQKSIEKTLERFNDESIPYISVDSLKKKLQVVLLDTRKKEEYQVSHLENAKWAGFKKFDLEMIKREVPNTETPIVVYCSIGVRSEKIGEQLVEAGYTNVKNLYGGIFQWVNNGNTIVDSIGHPTEKIHAFSKHWGKLLTKGDKVFNLKPELIENQ